MQHESIVEDGFMESQSLVGEKNTILVLAAWLEIFLLS